MGVSIVARSLVAPWKILLLVGIFECHAYKVSQYRNNSLVPNVTAVPLYKELASAMPLVLQNLTNYSGLINDKGAANGNITHHFGDLANDLAMLSDKVSGLYSVLHEMLPESGPFLCPLDKQSHIKECLLIATCLLEEHVPEDIELATFTTYMEMTQRFLDIGWEALKNGLLFEEQSPILNMDATAPEQYQCDLLKHKEVTASLLQVHESDGATLAMSSAMVHASTSSLKILEAHQVGSSVDATVLKLHEIWMPICKQLDCDHSSFWDLNYASYHQTASLLQLKSGHAARRAARNEIRHRVKLERRVVDFVSENYEYYSKIYNGSTHLPPGRRFVDSSFIQASSRAARSRLADMGRQSMLEHVIPFMKQIATQDENRAIRLFDHVEFRKFQQRKQRRLPASLLQNKEQQEDSSEDDEAVNEEDDHAAEFEDEDEDDHAPALLDMGMDSEEEEDTEDSLESGRRRRRSRRRRRRRWIGGRRRSRRRRRIFDDIVDAVAKVVEDVVEYMESLTGCLGYAIEFAGSGYDYEVVPGAVSISLGLSSGAKQALEDLISERPPSAFISLDFGFAVGVTKKLAWLGVGLGGSLACDSTAGCDVYITVASITSINLPTVSAFCPMGPNWGPATCAQSFGGGISTMCCSMGLQEGKNDCR
ncbi:TauD domain-containing protein [Durusdinium trenchii]|uniref:TauD domain-containing protein n=2 Tax=Durusdinium trenchii TaxID=1381693 RepID=A0ABP0HQI8_9DINO